MRKEVAIAKTQNVSEIALFLLRSLAQAGESNQFFEAAMEDWRRWSSDARSLPEFEQILSFMLQSGERSGVAFETVDDKAPLSFSKDYILLNERGAVVAIAPDVSYVLNLRKDDVLAQARVDSLSAAYTKAGVRRDRPVPISIMDRFNIERVVIVFPYLVPSKTDNHLIAILVRPTFGPRMLEFFSQSKGLTPTEIEILQAAARRYRIEQIAELKNISLNTVRTHISRLNKKLDCRSLSESLALATEMELSFKVRQAPLAGISMNVKQQSRTVVLPDGEGRFEFRRYGEASGRPLVLLHSGEYGFSPSDSFVNEAKARGVCLYFPLRPGFGSTSKALSSTEAARMLSGFVDVMGLRDVTLVALSTGAPTALRMSDPKHRIKRTVFVNYALNTPSKIEYIQPLWMQGLIASAIESPAAFKLAMGAARSILRKHGARNLYESLYHGFHEDLEFLKINNSLFEVWSDYFTGADPHNLMLDVVSSFTNLRNIDVLVRGHKKLTIINGDNQYLVPNDHVRAEAVRLGVEFYTVEHSGRNWLFAEPVKFFDFLERLDDSDAPKVNVA